MTTLQREEASHRLPHVLPGAHAVLFTTKTRRFGDWRATRIEALVRATGERRLLVEGGADARYVPTGHVLCVRNGTLMAVPFDASRLEVTGEPVGMIDGVLQAVSATNPGSRLTRRSWPSRAPARWHTSREAHTHG